MSTNLQTKYCNFIFFPNNNYKYIFYIYSLYSKHFLLEQRRGNIYLWLQTRHPVYTSIVSLIPFSLPCSLPFLRGCSPLFSTLLHFPSILPFLSPFLSILLSTPLSRFRPRYYHVQTRDESPSFNSRAIYLRADIGLLSPQTETFGTTEGNHADYIPLCQASLPKHAAIGLWLLRLGTGCWHFAAWLRIDLLGRR